MKLSFKKRRLLVQALYAFRAHHKDDKNFVYQIESIERSVKNILTDVIQIKRLSLDGNENNIVANIVNIVKHLDLAAEDDAIFSNKEHELVATLLPLLSEVILKEKKLDKIISNYLGKNWYWDRVASVVKMILRIGSYEMIFGDKKWSGMIISDYLDIARDFGHSNDIKFIHAVLDKIGKARIDI